MGAKPAAISSNAWIFLGALAIIILLALCSLLAAPAHGYEIDFPPADFAIRSPDGATTIGHSHYDVSHAGDMYVVHGENRYFKGEYDTEIEKMKVVHSRVIPGLVSYEHVFFDANRSLFIDDRLDVASGEGSCTRYYKGKPVTKAETFALPSDIYAGASLLIAIQSELRRRPNKTIELHDFNCVPKPRLLTIKARISEAQPWAYYSGRLADVNLKPELGWWGIFVSPFLPKTEVWFDPADDWRFVGGIFARYYGGPKVMLVRVTPEATVSRSSESSSSTTSR